MKRCILFTLVSSVAALAFGEVSFEDVIVRQLWPWSKNVMVEFVARGVTAPSQLEVAVTAGGQTLGTVPVAAYRTDPVLCSDGKHHVEFDPTAVPCLAGGTRRIGVALSAPEVPADERLYYVFDLTKSAGEPGQTACITTAALTNGVWGTWERRFWPKGEDALCWTGVTNDVKYATTHLVMRRIPAGTFKMGYAADDDAVWGERELPQKNVTLTRSYYIGVYEFTAAQWSLVTGAGQNADYGANLARPSLNDSYDKIRGTYTAPGALYDWPNEKSVDPGSFLGRLSARAGRAFDLPTEAQWEKACKAGTDGVYYSGERVTSPAARVKIAWCDSNSPVDGTTTNYVIHSVGGLLPNNYGLYDTLGNACEYVRDWMAGANGAVADTDPEGPTAAGADYWHAMGGPKRMVKGGSYLSNYHYIRPAFRTQNPTAYGQSDYGYRVYMPAE